MPERSEVVSLSDSTPALPGGKGFAALAFGLAAIMAVVLTSGMDGATLLATLSRLPPWAYAPITLLQVTMVCLAAWKWRRMLRDLSGGAYRLPLRSAVAATTLGTLAGQAMPIQIVTPAVRTVWARRSAIPVGPALASSLFEQVFDLLALAGLVLTLLLTAGTGAAPAGIAALAIAVSLTLTILIRPLLRLAGQMAHPVLPGLSQGMTKAASMPLGGLSAQMAISLLRIAIISVLTVGVLTLLAPGVDPRPLILALPLLQLASAFPLVPAGLGLVEAGWSGLLVAQGIDPGAAVATAVALRIVTTGPFLVVAPLMILIGARGVQR
ncbi:lysylphosphatidylglycerol synthase transmembrane domain-containing protein [Frigidibacter sp. MR17.14]|uniref:lysylphosphatidylglycerol synthase transmembrane domain-containing protein n=1 Tax=Frigidibacter sp. MR17.14 TaxID=3126509 RepID=UPI003012EE31